MTRHEALAFCKARIAEYLSFKGIDTSRAFLCLNPDHQDTRPSMRLDTARNKAHCFSCGADYDALDVMRIDHGLEGAELFAKAYEFFGLHVDGENVRFQRDNGTHTDMSITTNTPPQPKPAPADYSAYIAECRARIKDTDYPQQRGLTAATIEKYWLGFDPAWKHPKQANNPKVPASPRLIIPTSQGSYIARDTRPNLTGKAKEYSKMKVGPVYVFNRRALTEAQKPVFIVEAELDALSVIDVGGEAVGLGSTSSIKSFLEVVKRTPPQHPLIISLDNDNAGEKATSELQAGLEALNIPFYRINIAGEYKDASEALERDREAFTRAVRDAENIEQEAQLAEKDAYLKTSAAHRLHAFVNGIQDSVNTPVVPTGFTALDGLLDGGLYEGLYIMGAISSLGKTTLALQVIDQIASAGTDALIFSLEMSRDELIAKSISRLTMQEVLRGGGDTGNAKTVRGITEGKRYQRYSNTEHDLINKALGVYYDYASHIFITEGMGDTGVKQIREAVRKHILFTGNKPVVLVDYMQILTPYNERATDKQNTDRAVLELKRISRDFKVPVVAISSFNRAGYSDSVKMEGFKESGAIEYSADVLIGLQLAGAGGKDFNVDDAKSKNPRDVELVILKNRNGPTGGKTAFKYYAAFNYFVPVE